MKKITYKVEDGYKCSSVTIDKDKIEITFDKDDSMEITEDEIQVIREKFTELNNQINHMKSNTNTLLERATMSCINIK